MGGTSIPTEDARIGQSAPLTMTMGMAPPRQRNPTKMIDPETKAKAKKEDEARDFDVEEPMREMAEREQKEFKKPEDALR